MLQMNCFLIIKHITLGYILKYQTYFNNPLHQYPTFDFLFFIFFEKKWINHFH